MLVRVGRGPARTVDVRLGDVDDLSELAIAPAPDVSAAEGGYALFEGGAAVQQMGADFLISCEWLRSRLPAGRAWPTRLDATLRDQTLRYVPALDAVPAALRSAPTCGRRAGGAAGSSSAPCDSIVTTCRRAGPCSR